MQTFEKGGCEFQVFYTGGGNLKNIPMLGPKLGMHKRTTV